MKRKILGLLLIALSLMSFLTPVAGNNGDWEKLGSKVVNYKLEKDVIVVGANEGGFTKLRVVVKGGAINMHKMVVHFGNGTSENIELKHNFSKASASREIDLPGGKRIIKTIDFVYDTKNLAQSKAIVTVFGKH